MVRMFWNKVSNQNIGVYPQIPLISSGVGQCLTLPPFLSSIPYKSESFFTPAFFRSTVSLTVSTSISSPGLRARASATSLGIVALMLFPIFCNFTLVAISAYIREWIYLSVSTDRNEVTGKQYGQRFAAGPYSST